MISASERRRMSSSDDDGCPELPGLSASQIASRSSGVGILPSGMIGPGATVTSTTGAAVSDPATPGGAARACASSSWRLLGGRPLLRSELDGVARRMRFALTLTRDARPR